MNRIIVPIFILAAAMMLIIGLIIGTGQRSGEKMQDTGKQTYVLREYHGKLAVFPEGKKKPAEIIDFDIRLLPAYDQNLLHEGISAEGETALRKLLEDYTS